MNADGRNHGMHKYDPGVYMVQVFSSAGRPMGKTLRVNYQASLELAHRWKRMKGGTAVVTRCLFNSALGNPCYSEAAQ